MFLTQEELADLTGIKKGRGGKTRAQLQCEHLRRIGVPFFPNAAGEPKVPRNFFDNQATPPQKKASWTPRVLSRAA